MTREQMEQYLICCIKAKEKEEAIDRKNKEQNQVYTDIVKGSSKAFPYTEHPIKVIGYNIADLDRRRDRIGKLKLELKIIREECALAKENLEQYIDGLNDPQLRRILRLKYLDGESYPSIAKRIGGGNSAESTRQKVCRFFSK